MADRLDVQDAELSAALRALRRALKASADDEFTLLLAVGSDTAGDVQVFEAGRPPVAARPLLGDTVRPDRFQLHGGARERPSFRSRWPARRSGQGVWADDQLTCRAARRAPHPTLPYGDNTLALELGGSKERFSRHKLLSFAAPSGLPPALSERVIDQLLARTHKPLTPENLAALPFTGSRLRDLTRGLAYRRRQLAA